MSTKGKTNSLSRKGSAVSFKGDTYDKIVTTPKDESVETAKANVTRKGSITSQGNGTGISSRKGSVTSETNGNLTSPRKDSLLSSDTNGKMTSSRKGSATRQTSSNVTSPRKGSATGQTNGNMTTPRKGSVTDQTNASVTSPRRGSVTGQTNGNVTSPRKGSVTGQSNSNMTSPRQGNVTDPTNANVISHRRGSSTGQTNGNVTSPRKGSVTGQSNGNVTSPRKGSVTSQSNSNMTSPRKGSVTGQSNSNMMSPTRGSVTGKTNGNVQTPRRESVTSVVNGNLISPRRESIAPSQKGNSITGPLNSSLGKVSEVNDENMELKPMRNNGVQMCDMCDSMKQMTKRCIDCSSNMCSECSHYHSKMKITLKHDVVDFRDFYYNPPPSPPRSKIFCHQHKKQKFLFYCRNCMKPICTNCKLTSHEGHMTRELKDEIEEERELLPMRLSQIRLSYLPLLRQQLKDADEYQREFGHNVKATVDHIERRNKALKDEVDRTRGRVTTRLKERDDAEIARLTDRKQMLTRYIKAAQVALTSGESAVQTGDDFDIIDVYLKLHSVINTLTDIVKRKPTKTKFAFYNGAMNSATIETLFGSYTEQAPYYRLPDKHNSNKPVASLQIIPEVHASLKYAFKCEDTQGNKVSVIAPVGDGEAWICFGWSTNEIYLYNKSGFRKDRLKLVAPVDDVTVDHSGNLLVSTFSGTTIRRISRKTLKEQPDFARTSLYVRGLTVSSNNEIIACAVDSCSVMPPPAKSTFYRITPKGNVLATIDGDTARRIPIHPYRVSENIDGSLCIADLQTDKQGRVVVLNTDGKVRAVYNGHAKMENKTLLPYGICTDKYGNILVGDINNKEVHMLNLKGNFVRVLLDSAMLNGERPYSIAVDSMTHLWVGNERKAIKVFSYYTNTAHIH